MKKHLQTVLIGLLSAGLLHTEVYAQAYTDINRTESDHDTEVVTIGKSRIALEDAFRIIKSNYNINLIYEGGITTQKFVDFSPKMLKEKKPETVLNNLLFPFNLGFVKIDSQNYSIFKRMENTAEREPTVVKHEVSLLQIGTVSNIDANSAARVAKGKVLEANSGQPLPGVSVSIKGSSIGTSTDAEGKFQLQLTDDVTVLVFRMIGFKEREITVSASNMDKLVVLMTEDAQALKEVVVTGNIVRNKDSFTGATATFKGVELRSLGSQNLVQSLKTLDPAFKVIDNNLSGSNPNSQAQIEIRGKTSTPNASLVDEYNTDPNLPLFILDGFPVTLTIVQDLDMNRIASVTILKDAASTAIYGAKASNGVVVVETVKPKEGQLRVSYAVNSEIKTADLSDYNLMNASEKLEFERLSGRYKNLPNDPSYVNQLRLDSLYNARLINVQRGVNSYWLSEPLQQGYSLRNYLYAEGGTNELQYGVGVSYKKENGVMIGSGRDTWGANINLNYKKNKFLISNQLSVTGFNASESTYGSFSAFANANPYYPKYNADGSIQKYLSFVSDNKDKPVVNPLYNALQNNIDTKDNLDLNNKLQLVWTLAQGFDVKAGMQLVKANQEAILFVPADNSRFDKLSVFEKGAYTNTQLQTFSATANLRLSYNKTFNNKHVVYFDAATEIEQNERDALTSTAVGFPYGSNGNPAFAYSFTPNSTYNTYLSDYRRNNILVSGNYSFNNRYFVDASYRLDGSTAFGSDNLYSPFWSTGIGWNLKNESFMQSLTWLDRFRVTAVLGLTGNQSFGSFASVSTYNVLTTPNVFGSGYELEALGNSELEWQNTKEKSINTDISFFNQRLTLLGSVYQKYTDPLIIVTDLPSSTGIVSYPMNVGHLDTRGIEATVRFSPIYDLQKRIVWTIALNGSVVDSKYGGFSNKLAALNDKAEANSQSISRALERYIDGYSPNDIWAVRSAGIDPITGHEVFIKKDGSTTFDYDPNDVVKVGNTRPKLEGVISTTFAYKAFSMGVYLRYRVGGDYFNTALYNKVENITWDAIERNQDRRALYDRWQNVGDMSSYAGIYIVNTTGNAATPMSSRFVQRENTLTGESINFGYSFPNSKWLKPMGISNLRLNATANDIFRLSTIKAERGTEYPFARTVSFSLNASF
ncbi:SusC/RagA family TonB-linked outer membrane protein [Solitalea sp. MAHUQ-68]|uniref:SusC/RagA family TonB-linked outer membrane protein n=1 Tax=Solitalea agri TaxID=2953739 RepID=A0A9X2F1E7_9SPHI|nr:SusC/RagA family TonB-linked outer membrane protein [Solitalea agri]MCO4292446.1 SusC/RagA family TonB-linked outer membrane protein [Solitalea agri]